MRRHDESRGAYRAPAVGGGFGPCAPGRGAFRSTHIQGGVGALQEAEGRIRGMGEAPRIHAPRRDETNPTALAAQGLSLEDVRMALMQNNVNAPKGSFDGLRQSYAINANDQIFSAAEFRDVIIASKNGAPVRLRDVGDVIDNVENVRMAGWGDRSEE